MAIEIERKFLVIGDEWRSGASPGRRFCQGHVARNDGASVRIRRADDRAYITVKGEPAGIARLEFEYEIPVDDAEQMLETLCVRPLLEKTRYQVPFGGLVWEVDVFTSPAEGLVLAEVELQRTDQSFAVPGWAGREVTDDPRYRNTRIAVAGAPPTMEHRLPV